MNDDDIRSEIRAEFEREQAAFPPPGDLRPRFAAAAASAQPRARLNLQWVAAVAVLLIAALVVGALVASRVSLRGSTPAATPHALRFAEYGPPPVGVGLFYVADPNRADWYLGFDWTGTPRGAIKLSGPHDPNRKLVQAPAGNGFLIPAFKGLNGQVFDRLGTPLPEPIPSSVYHDLMWSDDSRQLCTLSFDGKWHIGLMSTAGAVTTSHVVAVDDLVVRSGVIAIRLAACSPQSDRAVLVYSADQYPTIVWVLRISDGKILLRRFHDRNQLADIVASLDGSLIAESSNKSSGYIAGPSAAQTVIRQAADGSVVATLDPSISVLAFSGDDTVALVATTPWASGVKSNIGIVDLASGTVVHAMESGELGGFVVQPDTKAFALFWKQVGDQAPHPLVSVYLIGTPASDGFLAFEYGQP